MKMTIFHFSGKPSWCRKLKLLLIDLALNWAMEKNGISLSPEYKLPRMRYKGTVVPQVCQADATLLLPSHVESCTSNAQKAGVYWLSLLLKVVRQHKRSIVREVKDVPEPPQIPLGFPSEQKAQQPGTSADAPPVEPKREQPATVFSFDRSKGNQQSQIQLEGNQLDGPFTSASEGEVQHALHRPQSS